MRLHRPSSRRDAEENLIPLINIVFLLLIFFMVAGRLAPNDPVVVHPVSSRSPDSGQSTSTMLIIDRQGTLWLNGAPVDHTTLVSRLAETPRADGQPLQIKADAEVPAARVMDILAQLRAAGAEQLELLTLARTP
jgi:biopolymer transport protein ExbD